jgi:hypothetical protein
MPFGAGSGPGHGGSGRRAAQHPDDAQRAAYHRRISLLEGTVTIPAGVAQVRVVLSAFAPTDLRTAGTVTFDEIGLFAE